jgi:hypothetical protein
MQGTQIVHSGSSCPPKRCLDSRVCQMEDDGAESCSGMTAEVQVPYELVVVDVMKGANKDPAYMKLQVGDPRSCKARAAAAAVRREGISSRARKAARMPTCMLEHTPPSAHTLQTSPQVDRQPADHPSRLLLQPFGKIPALEDPEAGITVFESRSILRCASGSATAATVASALPDQLL